jgi:hypothetical protein
MPEPLPEPAVIDAIVAPGHDGEAVLVVRIRHENGAIDSVTLDEERARRLIEACAVGSAAELRGQPRQRILDILGS